MDEMLTDSEIMLIDEFVDQTIADHREEIIDKFAEQFSMTREEAAAEVDWMVDTLLGDD